jgi:hypothetical protein
LTIKILTIIETVVWYYCKMAADKYIERISSGRLRQGIDYERSGIVKAKI